MVNIFSQLNQTLTKNQLNPKNVKFKINSCHIKIIKTLNKKEILNI